GLFEGFLDGLFDAGGHGGRHIQFSNDRQFSHHWLFGGDRLGFDLGRGGFRRLFHGGGVDLAAHAAALGRFGLFDGRSGFGGRRLGRFAFDHHGDRRIGRADGRQPLVDRAVLDLGLVGQFALTATPAATATTARAAVAAVFGSGDLIQADVLSRLLAGGLGPALVLAFGAGRGRVDGIEPDVRVLQRRRAAAHPGVDVAFAFLAHPATAATAPAAAAAPAVVVIVGSGGFGLLVTTSAATATATSAAAVVILFGAGASLVVVLVLAVEIGLVLVVAEVVFVLGVFVLIVIGAVVEAVVQVGQVDVAFGRDEVFVRFSALDRVFALGQAVVDLDDDVQAALLQQELQIFAL